MASELSYPGLEAAFELMGRAVAWRNVPPVEVAIGVKVVSQRAIWPQLCPQAPSAVALGVARKGRGGSRLPSGRGADCPT